MTNFDDEQRWREDALEEMREIYEHRDELPAEQKPKRKEQNESPEINY